jgi:hypothetical protein
MKQTAKIVLVVLMVSRLLALDAFAAKQDSLYTRFERSGTVKVHVSDLTREEAARLIDLGDLKSKIESAFQERKSILFKTVDSPDAADMVVACHVEEYGWSPTDPIDMLMGAGAIAMDAAQVQPYAHMNAVWTVKDSAGGVLWENRLNASVTKDDMSEADGIGLVNEKMIKVFFRKALSKKSARKNR